MTSIYLDHNATTPLVPEAITAMQVALERFGNPSSAHHAGRKARQQLDDARERIAARLGAHPDEVIFTSGATEANNLALFGLAGEPPAHLLAAAIEHPCIMEPLNRLASRGFALDWLPVTAEGIVEAASLGDKLHADTRLITLMRVNHETGAIQPVGDIAKALPAGVHVHCDAAQAVGKMPVDFRELGVTSLSASGHKFGGPTGIGLLLLKRETKLAPLFHGGHQQRGQRPGTEPVWLVMGFAAALDAACEQMPANHEQLMRLHLRFLARLRECLPAVTVNGPEPGSPASLPTTLNLSFPGCRADVLLMALDLAGIACSTGSACSSGSLLPSPVLRAMSVPEERLRSALRFSFSPRQTRETIDEAVARIVTCVQQVQAKR